MFKRFIMLIALVMATGLPALAQSSMTDQQIMDYVISENDKGVDRKTIVTNLMERGVSIDRIRKISKKYEKQKAGSVNGAKNITSSKSENRLRVNNGKEKEIKDRTSNYRKSNDDPLRNKKLTNKQRELMRMQREEEYYDEFDTFLPDSLEMYNDIFGEEEAEEDKPKKKIFGHDIFNNKDLTFEPEMNIATPADYRLGPGDVVYIDIYGASQKQDECSVTPDGYINISGYGPVQVEGLTVAQANSRLKATVGNRFAGSSIKLSVGQTKTITVHVFGDVQNPGSYTLSAFATVFNALYMAGGPTETGTLRNIKVLRNGRPLTTVDIYDYILNGNLKGNIRLASEDVIYVETYECLVNVTGKVKRPMYYEMKSNESVATLLKYAGGFTGDAYEDVVRLIRKKGEGGMYSFHSLNEFERGTFQLCDGDSVDVDSTLQRFSNMVEIRGAVMRPGMYQMDGSVSTLRQLIEVAGGLSEDAIKTRGILHRRKEDRSLETKSINIAGLLEHSIADIALSNEDVLYIPSRQDFNDELTLTIEGEVLYPGIYEYAENTTIEDLILQAGGLTDNASMAKVDVARRVRDNLSSEAATEIAEFHSFSIKEGFVIDDNEGFTLQPYDVVSVRRAPNNIDQRAVSVEGEITFGGNYTITKKNYRLSDLVKNAGGVTKDAYVKGAHLERRLTFDEKQRQQSIVMMLMRADTQGRDSLTWAKRQEISDTKIVGIELDKALEHPGNDKYDIVLEEGDRLVIPQYDNTVTISGEVMYPNTVAYNPQASLSYYINQAGGFGLQARKNRVFVMNKNGTASRVRSSKDIKPGSTIVVTAKAKKERLTTAQILSMSMSFASLGAVMINALR
ncbi:MAG: SLBB domain-containing protein [Bacteroidales bacterium]|nr:SLBB domain-containing protein [Candidatus Equimonas enterica]